MSEKNEQYTQELYKTLSYSNEQFDKNVLFIASGALGISFAFIENIIPDLTKAMNTGFLIWAWYLYASVIFISMLSHFISSLSLKWSIKHYGKDKFDDGMNNWNNATRGLNFLMMFGLLIGTILLINFIRLNIS